MSPSTLYHQLYGLRLSIRAERPEIARAAAALLPPGACPCEPGAMDRAYAFGAETESFSGSIRSQLQIDGECVSYGATDEELLVYFKLDARAYVVRSSPSFLFVHAGVVGWRGRAILLPGYSHSGKTTLVAALIRAGATYYSDDYAPIDSSGYIHTYPTDLAVRSGGAERREAPPEAFGGVRGRRPLRAGLIVFTDYQRGACWSPEPLSPGRAVHRLLPHTPSAGSRFKPAIRHLNRFIQDVTCLQSPRGDVSEAADAILRLASKATLNSNQPKRLRHEPQSTEILHHI